MKLKLLILLIIVILYTMWIVELFRGTYFVDSQWMKWINE